MGVYYETPPVGGHQISGAVGVIELDFPSRAYLEKIIIMQTDGAVGFTAQFFSTLAAAQAVAQSDSDGDDTGVLPDRLYQVTPTLAGVAGILEFYSNNTSGGSGYGFFNHEVVDNALDNRRKIYLRITPAVPGTYTFAIALGGNNYA